MHGRPEAPTPTAGEHFHDGRSGLDGITGGALPAEAKPMVAAVAGGVGGVLELLALHPRSSAAAAARRRAANAKPRSLFLTEMEI